jgi:ankyrin repeat protein
VSGLFHLEVIFDLIFRCVQLLLTAGADFHLRTRQGFVPLHLAAYFGNEQVVENVSCSILHGIIMRI